MFEKIQNIMQTTHTKSRLSRQFLHLFLNQIYRFTFINCDYSWVNNPMHYLLLIIKEDLLFHRERYNNLVSVSLCMRRSHLFPAKKNLMVNSELYHGKNTAWIICVKFSWQDLASCNFTAYCCELHALASVNAVKASSWPCGCTLSPFWEYSEQLGLNQIWPK